MACYTSFKAPIGELRLVATDEALVRLDLPGGHAAQVPEDWEERQNEVLADAVAELRGYFRRRMKEFTVPLAPDGTPFQLEVWQALRKVPYGTTVSYLEIARAIGKPSAVRAVGHANGANPIAIIIPCHRVIGHHGDLVGYGGGLPMKQWLLALEGVRITQPTQSSSSAPRKRPRPHQGALF